MRPPSFDSLTLRAVVAELQETVVGAQVQRIRQPDEHTVLLRTYGAGGNHWLLLCSHPERFRAHLTTRSFDNPQAPPTFCMALRKYLEGGRVLDAAQDGADRVLRLAVGTAHGLLYLVIELMGRHSNIVLVGEDGGVLEAIKHVGTRMSHRVILPGRPYPPLPPSGKPSLWDAPWPELEAVWEQRPSPLTAKWLLDSFGGMSPFLAEHILSGVDPHDNAVKAARSGRFEARLFLDEAGLPAGAWPASSGAWPADRQVSADSISAALDDAYAHRSEGARRAALLREANAILDREAHILARRRDDLARLARDAERSDEWRVMGELLTANPHAIPRGEASVDLPNYYDAEMRPLTIPLDPALSARENAEVYFARQRKANAAAERLPEQAAQLDAREAELAARRAEAESAGEAELEALIARWSGPAAAHVEHRGKRREPELPPGVRIRRFTSDEGYAIWVGENATGNDYLTTRASDPDDIWLHVRAAASAHGVIKTGKHPERVPPATLRRAAEIVAARSEAKGSGVIPVDYTLRRYVRKPRGSAPGRVTYEREKTIFVEKG